MKKLLNSLYVTTQGAYLSREGETVSVKVDGQTKLRLPIHTLDSIVCFGNVSCSPFLMGLCGERRVTLAFFTENGRFLARVYGPVHGNVLLRKEQYRRSDDLIASASIARSMVLGKISNCRVVLQRTMRDRGSNVDNSVLSAAVGHLAEQVFNVKNETNLDSLRGLEGVAANAYFGVFDQLIQNDKENFFFKDRSRRPPLDNMNALLSFLYTLLVHDVGSALEGVGLDPAVGFLHRDRPGRPSLALDVMEELRPYMADRLALTLVNRQQVSAKSFCKTESGAVVMNDECRKTVLVAWQKRKQEEIVHPFLEEKVHIGLLPHIQALLLSRYLRGDLDGYPPFLWR